MMTPSELRAAIGQQIYQATGSVADEISDERAELFERYMGDPYGDEVTDRSQVISTDISDAVEWIMPELVEIFASGDKIGAFEPQGPEDEEAAEQETETINHIFWQKNDGFMVLYNFLKDGLIQKNGYAKRWWSKRDRVTTEEYDGLSIEEWLKMQQDWAQKGWEVEILRAEADGFENVEMEDITPESLFGVPLSVEVRLSREEERLVVESVPPEELIVSPRWNKVNLDECPFVAHRRKVTVSDLVEMGYDRKQVEGLPEADDEELSDERIERFSSYRSSEYEGREAADPSMREILVHECFIRVDYDDDGRAELRRIMVGGAGYEILKFADGGLDNDEVETQPFSAWTPVPIPHRHYGRSIAELVSDLQRIKTVLFRQLLDNVYLTNNPTREIASDGIGEHTLSDLLSDRPGKVVRTEAPGHYQEHSPPQFMHQMLPAIEYVDSVRENRTGVSRYNQGLDGDSLNKTAHGIERIMSASMKKLALYARVCAETGLKHLLMGIHGDLRRGAGKKLTLRLRGKYVSVDPRSWAERSDFSVNIGAGNVDKQLKLAFLEKIILEQKEHLMSGSPLVKLPQLFNTYERFIAVAGFKNPEEFFVNPMKAQQEEPKEDKEDPQIEAYKAVEAAKIREKEAEAQAKYAIEIAAKLLEDDRERDKSNMEFALRVAEMQANGIQNLTMESLKQEAGLDISRRQNVVDTTIEKIRAGAALAQSMNQPPSGGMQ